MLKFLENRQEKSVARQTIRNKPHVGFGISLESPAEFQHEHSMISSNTFVSPYLPFEPARKSVIPLEKLHLVCPKWTRKTDLTQIEVVVHIYRPVYLALIG